MNVKKILFGIIIILIFEGFIIYSIILFSKNNNEDEEFEKNTFITKVIDGDTIIAQGENIRLLGIDADERGYPCYNEAKKRLEELTLNKNARLEKDRVNKDKYNRLLRYVFLNETNVNLKLVEEGLAIARFQDNDKYKREIVKAESNARENKIGCKWKEI